MKSIKPSLLTKFSVMSLFIMAAIAIILAWVVQYNLERSELRQAAETAAGHVSAVLNANLSSADLQAPLHQERYEQIDTLIQQNILSSQIARIKIWNRDGQVLYSDDKEVVGRLFPRNEELKEALEGKIAMEISDLKKPENISEKARFPRLMEIYVPLRPKESHGVEGAYEVYFNMSILEPYIKRMRLIVSISVGVGFLILYGSLFTLVRNASHELIRRNEENFQLFQEEQSRRQELTVLYDLSRTLADAVNDFNGILNAINRNAIEITHVTFSRIMLIRDDHFLVCAAHPVRLLGQELDVGREESIFALPYCRIVLEKNEPVVIDFNSPDVKDHERKTLFLNLAQTLCLIPLRVGDTPLGFLMLGEARNEQRELFTQDKIRLARSIGDQAASAIYRVQLFTQLERAYEQTVFALANAVDAKDTYTADHADRLVALSLSIGREIGMGEHELEDLRYGAILHDIGKLGVPDAILLKPSKLTVDEWEVMRQHPVIGAKILASVPRLKNVVKIVLHHHERYDGEGYPNGLAGETIPLGARILTVVDSYCAIIDKRVYKEARSTEEAFTELRRCARTQFDPVIVDTLIRLNCG